MEGSCGHVVEAAGFMNATNSLTSQGTGVIQGELTRPGVKTHFCLSDVLRDTGRNLHGWDSHVDTNEHKRTQVNTVLFTRHGVTLTMS